jgi:hypothetical protein
LDPPAASADVLLFVESFLFAAMLLKPGTRKSKRYFYFFVTPFHAPAIAKAVKSPSIAHNAAIEASTWTNG